MGRPTEVLNASMTTDSPGTLQVRTEYNADGTALYVGYAPMGALSSDNQWTIHTFTYVNQQNTLRQTGLGTWDNRSSLTFA